MPAIMPPVRGLVQKPGVSLLFVSLKAELQPLIGAEMAK
jgi:hypothetical protein